MKITITFVFFKLIILCVLLWILAEIVLNWVRSHYRQSKQDLTPTRYKKKILLNDKEIAFLSHLIDNKINTRAKVLVYLNDNEIDDEVNVTKVLQVMGLGDK